MFSPSAHTKIYCITNLMPQSSGSDTFFLVMLCKMLYFWRSNWKSDSKNCGLRLRSRLLWWWVCFVCVLAWTPLLCVWSLFFFLPLTHSGGHVVVGFKEAQTHTHRTGSSVNPVLLSEHQGRNKASAAMQIPQVHCPINVITTAAAWWRSEPSETWIYCFPPDTFRNHTYQQNLMWLDILIFYIQRFSLQPP